MMIGRLLCRLGFHWWIRPYPYYREVCRRCGKKAEFGVIKKGRY
jgi:hypothetical protein